MNRINLHNCVGNQPPYKLLNSSKKPLVSIIIVNFNGKDLIYDCLRSVFKTNYSPYEVIVVDNGSTDNSCALIERDFKRVFLVKNQSNLGYSKGNNIGILHSRGEFIVLLNNDTTVHPNWLSELIKEAIKNPDCLYQPKILLESSLQGNKKTLNSAGNIINLFGFAFPRGLGQLDTCQYDEIRHISYASGACTLISKKLLEKIGLLDDEFYTFYEDVNWGWRALMLGYNSVYVPSSVIYHKWGGSWGSNMSSGKFFLIERGRLATVFRNYSFYTLTILFPGFISIECLVLLYCCKNGLIAKKLLGYSDLIKAKGTLINQRKKLQKIRRNSDRSVIDYFSDELNHPYLGEFAVIINKIFLFFCKTLRPLIR